MSVPELKVAEDLADAASVLRSEDVVEEDDEVDCFA